MPHTILFALALAAAPPGANAVPAERMRRDVSAVVTQRLQAIGSDARIVAIEGLRDQTLPAGRVELSVGTIAGRWPRARAGVPVRIEVDGRVVRTLTAWVSLRDLRTVLAYESRAAAGTRGDALRLQPAEVDMTCCEGAAVVDAADLAGLRLRRAARAGMPALASDFEPAPAVEARARVEIEVERGGVRLSTPGIALADGRIGDRVRVRPEATEQTVLARVVATRKVRIDEDTF